MFVIINKYGIYYQLLIRHLTYENNEAIVKININVRIPIKAITIAAVISKSMETAIIAARIVPIEPIRVHLERLITQNDLPEDAPLKSIKAVNIVYNKASAPTEKATHIPLIISGV